LFSRFEAQARQSVRRGRKRVGSGRCDEAGSRSKVTANRPKGP